jgi:acetoin utilization deacetylase AcuC-like enzyme
MASTFQHPFYPYSGTDSPASNMVNIPLAAGAGSREFREAVREGWIPALNDYRPELVLFSPRASMPTPKTTWRCCASATPTTPG